MGLRMKKVVSMLLMAVIFTSSVFVTDTGKAEAAVDYITVEAFAKSLAVELGLKAEAGSESSGYVNALKNKGIIKDGDFTSYTKYLTRGDAAVLLNRADEYLYGDTLGPELVSVALEKRISDIKTITKSKRTDVVKAYLKGFIKGYSNGTYSTNREFRGSKKITKAGALSCIKLLKDKASRAKISPDGQLIRTTKLPKNAKMFPYILESFPNSYYERKFKFETSKILVENNREIKMENLVHYAAPVDMDKLRTERYPNFPELKKEKLNEWVAKAENHLKLVFNVDYRTIDDSWAEQMIVNDYAYGSPYEKFSRRNLNKYVEGMKANKTIVEANVIKVDGSSLYFLDESFYLRAYVKFRIVSSVVTGEIDVDTLIDEHPYEKVLFTTNRADLRGYKLGEWIEGYYNIVLGEAYGDNGNLGVVSGIY